MASVDPTTQSQIDALSNEVTTLSNAITKLEGNATKYYDVLDKLKTALKSVEDTAGGSQDTLLKGVFKDAVTSTITNVDSGKTSVEGAVSATVSSMKSTIDTKNSEITHLRNG